MSTLLRCLSALCWALLALGKHLPAQPIESDLPAWLIHASSAMELLLAITILTRWRRSAYWIGAAFCAAAMTMAALEPSGTCACVGGLPSSARLRFLVAGGLGTLCATLLAFEPCPPRPPVAGTQPTTPCDPVDCPGPMTEAMNGR